MADSICVGCGMCCDGTLFERVDVLQADQPDLLRSLGLELHDDDNGLVFRQPCRCSTEGRCTIYDNRPTTCRTYRCTLLMMVEAGDIDTGAALDVIARTKARRDEVVPAMRTAIDGGESMGFYLLHRALHQFCADADDPVAARKEHAGTLLRTGGVHVQLVRHFYGTKDDTDDTPPAMGAERSEPAR